MGSTSMRTAGSEELTVRATDNIPGLELTADEREAIRATTDTVLAEDPGRPLEERLERLALHAHGLPLRLRSVLNSFRLTGRPYGGLVISGLPIDESAVGPTPLSYTDTPDGAEAERAAALLLLTGSLLGNPFSYLTQQRGRLVLDVFPVRGHEESQLGSSSTVNLEWHNEDAFHPLRADWLMLFCLRNHDRVPTTFLPIQDVPLDQETSRVLFEDRFVVLPDESHTAAFNEATTGVDEDDWVGRAFKQVAEMNSSPHRTAVLTGDPAAPFVRLDPAFMERDLDDEPAEKALDQVIRSIDDRIQDVVLAPGELLVIDNKRAVHGRRPFEARYDGSDRWLRRINITADLRQSEDRRYGSHGRAIV
ncbi:arginine beta-hydroxylase, Fe(II)/alpha-ketoglutarate-dependent [Actinacidiphila yanglinensis]|uniref:Arginine beta-hydroxylase, Fe(II)/alpha-ketoglutarate-dependent n=1 Tax=Actinacidiphila yanglinensis TaxID=310779 RepID=A0A1H6DG56_9ACTN|nr:guanitoxin biosynthesis L-enduracididine beta-hydroxylase GntD [Actinacidiphila yanglinensis]SEG84338.1 arginine beta-hydroxylase, Fe(II)/alpha-ketoglutarate-dependent [Actinacidiphila yanglinensis]